MMERDETLRHQAHALMAKGVTPHDSAVAVSLSQFILDIDGAVFPHRPADVHCHPKSHPDGFIAGFDDDITNPLHYVVYAGDLYRQFRESCLRTRFVPGYGPGRPCPTLREHLMVVALHEVRHRLQVWLGADLRLWTPWDLADGLMAGVMKTVCDERLYDIMQAEVTSERLLQGQLKEFDALVIEYYARHFAHQVREASGLAHLVWLEP